MSKTLRRFEVLLPLRFNDGQPVPDEIVADTLLELEQRFGAVSCETMDLARRSYRDDLIRVFVDVGDDQARFQQLDIWMTTYLVECDLRSDSRTPRSPAGDRNQPG